MFSLLLKELSLDFHLPLPSPLRSSPLIPHYITIPPHTPSPLPLLPSPILSHHLIPSRFPSADVPYPPISPPPSLSSLPLPPLPLIYPTLLSRPYLIILSPLLPYPCTPIIPLHFLSSAPLTSLPSHPLPSLLISYPVLSHTLPYPSGLSRPYPTILSPLLPFPRIPSPTYVPSQPYPTLAFPTLRSPRVPSPSIPSHPQPSPTISLRTGLGAETFPSLPD